MMRLLHTQAKARYTLLLVSALVLATYLSTTFAQGTVTVTGVAVNHSSVKVYFNPVLGAKDYRVYDVTNPNNVKYAGMAHLTASTNCPGSSCFNHFAVQADGVTPVYPYQILSGASGGPQVLDVPAAQIEWNSVGDGASHSLIVEAVDQLGPAPQANLYSGPLNTPLVSGGTGMLGSNKGPTGDGKISTNGQGPYTNNPQVIARSQAFVVQADPNLKAVPSKATATQTFYDTFENAENAAIVQVSRSDTATDSFGNLGSMTFTLNAGTPKAWEIEYRRTNNRDSMPFITGDHFMDMIFDGATPGNNTGAPTHTIYGSMSMTPTKTLGMSNGKVIHLTMEVDGHQSFRRWLDFNLAPASDPLKAWDPNGSAINTTNQGLFLEVKDGFCTLDIYTGTVSGSDPSPTGTAGGSHGARLWGLPGSTGGGAIMCGWDQMYVPRHLSKNALGLDERSRYDFFLSQTHAALFHDGRLIVQSDIPAGTFPWANVPLRAYYSHYIYHSDDDIIDLKTYQQNGQTMCYPLNSYWFNDPVNGTPAGATPCNRAYPAGYGFPYSDERHWDNMGFEVLLASDVPANDFSSLASLVQPPVTRAPQFGPVAPTNLRIVGLLVDALFPLRHAMMLGSHPSPAVNVASPPPVEQHAHVQLHR